MLSPSFVKGFQQIILYMLRYELTLKLNFCFKSKLTIFNRCSPGINDELFELLKYRLDTYDPIDKFVSLSFDEMTCRKGMSYSRHLDTIFAADCSKVQVSHDRPKKYLKVAIFLFVWTLGGGMIRDKISTVLNYIWSELF